MRGIGEISFLCVHSLEQLCARVQYLGASTLAVASEDIPRDAKNYEEGNGADFSLNATAGDVSGTKSWDKSAEELLHVYMESMQQLDRRWTETLLAILRRTVLFVLMPESKAPLSKPLLSETSGGKVFHSSRSQMETEAMARSSKPVLNLPAVDALLTIIERQMSNGFDLSRRDRCMEWLLDLREEIHQVRARGALTSKGHDRYRSKL